MLDNLIARVVKEKPDPAESTILSGFLQQVVDDAIGRLGCLVAAVAILERDERLRIHAYATRVPASRCQQVAQRAGVTAKLLAATLKVGDATYDQNLAVRAIQAADNRLSNFMASDHLIDLLQPFVPPDTAQKLQQELNIQQVIAVPYWVDGAVAGLFLAASQERFDDRAMELLSIMGSQLVDALESERRLVAMAALERVTLTLQEKMTNETDVLQLIVEAVVHEMRYVGAMVATLEAENALPVRAYAVDVMPGLVQQLEKRAGISFVGPKSVVYLDNDRYRDNLSVRAVRGEDGRPTDYLISDRLYDLFRPVVGRTFSDVAQKLIGIRQVIALPFHLQDQVVGNLFVATRRSAFTEQEINILMAFSRQAAVGIRNARLYRVAEERRQIAQMFGRMAFSAAASVHALRNQVGIVRSYIDVLDFLKDASEEERNTILSSLPEMVRRLDGAVQILDNLHEPWHHSPDRPVSVNDCLKYAMGKQFPGFPVGEEQPATGISIGPNMTAHLKLDPHGPQVMTSPDMLTEAFRIIIKNAAEAIDEHHVAGVLCLESHWRADGTVTIFIRDNGQGIKPEYMGRIFEMGWSTKQGKGMGFGLYWTKDFVDGLNGRIHVTSQWQQGTAFHIELPTVGDRPAAS